ETPGSTPPGSATVLHVSFSWNQISDRGKMANGRGQVVDDLNAHQGARFQLGHPRCSGDAIVDHEFSIRAAADFNRWHALHRCSVLRNLALQFVGVGTAPARGRHVQRPGIHIEEYTRHMSRLADLALRWKVQMPYADHLTFSSSRWATVSNGCATGASL